MTQDEFNNAVAQINFSAADLRGVLLRLRNLARGTEEWPLIRSTVHIYDRIVGQIADEDLKEHITNPHQAFDEEK